MARFSRVSIVIDRVFPVASVIFLVPEDLNRLMIIDAESMNM